MIVVEKSNVNPNTMLPTTGINKTRRTIFSDIFNFIGEHKFYIIVILLYE